MSRIRKHVRQARQVGLPLTLRSSGALARRPAAQSRQGGVPIEQMDGNISQFRAVRPRGGLVLAGKLAARHILFCAGISGDSSAQLNASVS